jgi:HAD superfamily hydrolase (TIGR01549 family)
VQLIVLDQEATRTYTTILFDLDGTLLPMDVETFVSAYLSSIGRYVGDYGLDSKRFSKGIYGGIEKMFTQDSSVTNYEKFWAGFYDVYPMRAIRESDSLDIELLCTAYYENEFDEVSSVAHPHPIADEIVKMARRKGYKTVVATNPLFPRTATYRRLAWAGLDPDDFEFVTTYEDHRHVKPMKGYYREILSRLGVNGEECLMVGNDMREDRAATQCGTGFYLVTPYLLNHDHVDTSAFDQGTLEDLFAFVEAMPVIR